MPAVTATRLEAQAAEGQREVVGYDQQSLAGDGLALQPVADRVSAEVHKRIGLEDDQLGALEAQTGHSAVTLLGEVSRGGLRHGVDHAEADVVARAPVFGADVAQSDNEKFHL